ncbi:hypothetical protein PCA31118_03931 [Pandoraea captiosa]|uniref:Uncharacterized protein n=1 Tax=Pandoraea captiosa TaxID=2508302 RepID=A0A5E5AEK8_9BURK|nr:hypothetical protein [Pandoraea captiosa]VVE71638.1 hypothetical protein PCA31118_03931 [Pandoraea captiosa]
MAVWTECEMATLFYSGEEASEHYRCTVKIDDERIIVEYEDGYGGTIQYLGENQRNGHFLLTSAQVKGRASLHRFPDSSILEGSWIEEGERGMWRIELAGEISCV